MGDFAQLAPTVFSAQRAFVSLEFELDGLLIELFPELEVPFGMSRKLDLLFDAYIQEPKLRQFGLSDGSLDLNKMNYWLSEIADHRNHIVHGSLFYTEQLDDDVLYIFRRRVRDVAAPGKMALRRFKTFKSHLCMQAQVAEMLSSYFRDAARFLRGQICSDHYAKSAKKQALQKEWWQSEGQYLDLIIPEELSGLEPLIKGELSLA